MTVGTHESLLVAARGGDEAAFRELIEPHLEAIHGLCYRMLGSVHDADDAVQDALVRAWRGIHRFEERSELRTWLHRIATNVCLDVIRARPRRILPVDYGPPSGSGQEPAGERGDVNWLEPYPGPPATERPASNPEARYAEREAVELSFVAALQFLPPRQRAVFLLRNVLGFSAREVAEILGTSTASVNSALQRARESIANRLPREPQQEELRRLGDERLRRLVREVVDAFERGDIAAILALLAEDVTFSMPPYEAWYRGRDAVAESWLMPADRPTGLRFVPVRANGQIALGVYKLDADRGAYLPNCLEVLGLRGELIAEVTSFRDPRLLRRFGLPEELPADD